MWWRGERERVRWCVEREEEEYAWVGVLVQEG